MYERSSHRLISRVQFFWRMVNHLIYACIIIFIALTLGAIGYHGFEHLSWLDAYLNAAMLLGGMGPVNPLQTDNGKLFAILYALFSGIIFIMLIGLILAPIAHRLLHHFHLATEEDGNS